MAQVAPAVSTSSGNVSVSAPSPGGASSAADESLDDSKSIRGGSPASWPHTPAQLSQGQVFIAGFYMVVFSCLFPSRVI